jgi:hypothetical protein
MAAALVAICELDGQAQAEGTDTGPNNIHRRDLGSRVISKQELDEAAVKNTIGITRAANSG